MINPDKLQKKNHIKNCNKICCTVLSLHVQPEITKVDLLLNLLQPPVQIPKLYSYLSSLPIIQQSACIKIQNNLQVQYTILSKINTQGCSIIHIIELATKINILQYYRTNSQCTLYSTFFSVTQRQFVPKHFSFVELFHNI